MNRSEQKRRRGAALVLFVATLIPILAFCALAIDLGLLAAARTQCQQAADCGAMIGARTLNGDSTNSNNYSAVTPAVQNAAAANTILGKPVQSSQLTIDIGRYVYNTSNQRFEGQFPGPSSENWSMVRVKVASNLGSQLAFSRIMNFTPSNMQAVATAVHRPRDVAIILDYSGSMRFASLMGDPHYGNRTSNNGDSVIPVFGHYSASGSAALQASSFNLPYYEANISATTADGRAPIIQDFYQDGNGSPAFTPASGSYAITPGGDNFLRVNKNTGSTYATTLAEILNLASVTLSTRDASFEATGYSTYGMQGGNSQGYTQGPGYWGKTFFIWPPDPGNMAGGGTADWRKRYFTYPGSSTPMDDNSRLWTSGGSWRAPGSSTYAINYAAILNWIKNIGPNPFPSRLQSGRILYYDQIPNNIDTSSFPPSDPNQRFWKDYIDFCLGLVELTRGNWQVVCNGSNGLTGYGADYAWGTPLITPKANLQGTTKPYMFYLDNPLRPRQHFWFGPLSMVDFLGCYNLWYTVSPNCSRFCWWPGTCHESPMYACKLGIRAALNDIKTNHPNDLVSLIMFSAPRDSVNDNDGSRFNRVRVGLSRNYDNMLDSLWYPPSTLGNVNALIRPYDADNLEVPRAAGGTCYAMPLMLAYNQFSANSGLKTFNPGAPSGDAGGNGRKGAQKIIIFETDGAPNTTASAGFTNSGAYNSYYNVRYNSASPGGSEYPYNVRGYNDNDSAVTSQIYNLCRTICASDSASPAGYSTSTKKVQIHCIGFGPVFDAASPDRAAAIATLNQMQQIGNVTDGMPSYKIIVGDEATVASKLQQAFTKILQNGIQVSLIQ
jgi:Flp pilus assembly protein TadG